jgi:hypothetical protein
LADNLQPLKDKVKSPRPFEQSRTHRQTGTQMDTVALNSYQFPSEKCDSSSGSVPARRLQIFSLDVKCLPLNELFFVSNVESLNCGTSNVCPVVETCCSEAPRLTYPQLLILHETGTGEVENQSPVRLRDRIESEVLLIFHKACMQHQIGGRTSGIRARGVRIQIRCLGGNPSLELEN